MTRTDWLGISGFCTFGAGLFVIYKPAAVLFAGLVLLLLARIAHVPQEK
jgi:hypothetical protein